MLWNIKYSGDGESNRESVCNEPECSFSGASDFITSMWQTGGAHVIIWYVIC